MSHPKPSIVFPAYAELGQNIGRRFATWRVYMHLVHAPILNHHIPTEVKVTGLGAALGMSPRKVVGALDWLVTCGYIVEHDRHERRVRSFTLAWELAKAA